MKIKEVTLHLVKKVPIEGIQFSNKEAGYSITVELNEDEKFEPEKLWEVVKEQVEIGLGEDKQAWLNKKSEEVK